MHPQCITTFGSEHCGMPDTMHYDFGEVTALGVLDERVDRPSVSGGSSIDFQSRCQPCGTKESNIDCTAV